MFVLLLFLIFKFSISNVLEMSTYARSFYFQPLEIQWQSITNRNSTPPLPLLPSSSPLFETLNSKYIHFNRSFIYERRLFFPRLSKIWFIAKILSQKICSPVYEHFESLIPQSICLHIYNFTSQSIRNWLHINLIKMQELI